MRLEVIMAYLSFLDQDNPCSLTYISRNLGSDKTNVLLHLKKLECYGLVKKSCFKDDKKKGLLRGVDKTRFNNSNSNPNNIFWLTLKGSTLEKLLKDVSKCIPYTLISGRKVTRFGNYWEYKEE